MDISKAFLPFSYPLTTFFFFTVSVFVSLFSVLYPFTSVLPVSPSFYIPSILPVCLLFLLSIFILKPSTFLPITSLFSMFFFSFLHSLASSLIFLLTFIVFPLTYTDPTILQLKAWSQYCEEAKGWRGK